jgi:hypothetical protein
MKRNKRKLKPERSKHKYHGYEYESHIFEFVGSQYRSDLINLHRAGKRVEYHCPETVKTCSKRTHRKVFHGSFKRFVAVVHCNKGIKRQRGGLKPYEYQNKVIGCNHKLEPCNHKQKECKKFWIRKLVETLMGQCQRNKKHRSTYDDKLRQDSKPVNHHHVKHAHYRTVLSKYARSVKQRAEIHQ